MQQGENKASGDPGSVPGPAGVRGVRGGFLHLSWDPRGEEEKEFPKAGRRGPCQAGNTEHAVPNPEQSLQPPRALTGPPDVHFRTRATYGVTSAKEKECFKEGGEKNRSDVAGRPRRIRTETCPLQVARLLEASGEASVGRWEQKRGCSGLRAGSVRSEEEVETGKAAFSKGFWVERGGEQESRVEEG